MGVVIQFPSQGNDPPHEVELPDPFGPLTEDQHERFIDLAQELDTTTDHDQIVAIMVRIQKEVVGWSVT